MQLGTTFDIDQAKSLDLDPIKSVKRIIGLGFSPVRIGIKWSRVEEQKNRYNWREYDAILNLLNASNIPTVLCVGIKSPRWPEFYIPQWLHFEKEKGRTISLKDKLLKEHLFEFIASIFAHFKSFRCIQWIQVENEPFFPFGPNKWKISHDLVKAEIDFIRTKTKLPIILTSQGLPTTGIFPEIIKRRFRHKQKILELADIVGLNIFPAFRGKNMMSKSHIFKASSLAWKYLQFWVHKIQKSHKECWITELQAEPWEMRNVNMNNAFGNITCNPTIIKTNLQKLKNIGISKIFLWGIEFHLGCEKVGNDEWIKIIKTA